ncbi:MAG TPA: flagellar motor protein MotB [Bacillota bacterium]|nr:flagellar motor protein MotB [Bacillota bacterium]
MKKPVDRKKENDSTDSWLLPYADMLTLLLALFIVLFAMSKLDVQKYEKLSNIFKSEFSSSYIPVIESIEEDTGEMITDHTQQESADEQEEMKENVTDSMFIVSDQLTDIQENINAYITENNLTDTLGTKLTDEGLLITLSTDFSFATGSAYVNDEGREIAHEIAEFLYTDPPHEIVISGHADDRPMYNHEFKSNWELSVMRAVNFMVILLENDRLNQGKFSAKGYGEYKPLVPNTNKENRAKNRRVEVLIRPLIQQVD